MNRTHASERGQVLIEALVALSVLTVGFLGMLSLLNQSLGVNRVVADNYTATYLAAEGIEIVKNMLDRNVISGTLPWYGGFSIGSGDFEIQYDGFAPAPWTSPGRILYYNDTTRLYGYGATSHPTNFRRRIVFTVLSPDQVQVNSIVTWETRGGGTFSTNQEARFFNWFP